MPDFPSPGDRLEDLSRRIESALRQLEGRSGDTAHRAEGERLQRRHAELSARHAAPGALGVAHEFEAALHELSISVGRWIARVDEHYRQTRG